MSEEEKKINCEIVQDLIPLYLDDVCSVSSRQMVENHIDKCQNCKEMLSRLQNITYDNSLVEEKTNVLRNYAKKEKKRSFMVGVVTAGILMIPIIICLICNILIGHALDWFFIVLTSLMLFASITVVPMMVSEKRFLLTLGSFFVSLELLLLTICIYSRGNWFFLASVPIIFGLSVIFMPYILKQILLPHILKNKKGLISVTWDTLWLFGIIFVCGFHTAYEAYWHTAILCTLFGLCFVWSVFLIARYLKLNKVSKTGIIIAVIGSLMAITNDVVNNILGVRPETSLFKVDFSVWSDVDVLNSNINCLIGIISIIVGVILFILGIVNKNNKLRRN